LSKKDGSVIKIAAAVQADIWSARTWVFFFEKLGWYEVPVAEASKAAQAAPQVRRDHQVGWYPNERAFRRDLI